MYSFIWFTNLRGARAFLNWLAASGMHLKSVRIADIDPAIEAKTARKQYSCATIRGDAKRLRTFFRFAEDRGWCTPGMAEGIAPLRSYPDETVRGTLTRADIGRLLATTDGDRPVHKRDRAILMLLIVYGLRAGEIRGLRLDDLDWQNETLRVHRPKTGRTDLLPLSRAVGQAIVRYFVRQRGHPVGAALAGRDVQALPVRLDVADLARLVGLWDWVARARPGPNPPKFKKPLASRPCARDDVYCRMQVDCQAPLRRLSRVTRQYKHQAID